MPTTVFDSIQASLSAISQFLIAEGSSLPDALRDALIQSSGRPSPVDRIVEVGEALYTHADYLSADGKQLCGALMIFATSNGWHGLPTDNRGGRIAAAMRREAGEEAAMGTSWPEPESDPAPKVPTVVEPAPLPTPT